MRSKRFSIILLFLFVLIYARNSPFSSFFSKISENGNTKNISKVSINADKKDKMYKAHQTDLSETKIETESKAGIFKATANEKVLTISASASAGTIACNGGTTNLVVTTSGGTPPFEYRLSTGTYQFSNTFTVGAGTFTVTVKDATNDSTTLSPIVVSQPTLLVATPLIVRNDSCQGNLGVVKVTASGGTAPYTVSWNPSVGTASPSTSISSSGSSINIINISGGNALDIIVTDNNGCLVL
jgi:hypothetical protein